MPADALNAALVEANLLVLAEAVLIEAVQGRLEQHSHVAP